MNHCCPVCRQEVHATRIRHTITAHLDSAGRDVCPMTGHPFDLTISNHVKEVASQ